MVRLPFRGESQVRRVPQTLWEWEGIEALRRRVAEILLQRTAILPRPDFVEGGVDDGEKVPAVGSQDLNRVSENISGRYSTEGQVLSRRCRAETPRLTCQLSPQPDTSFVVQPPLFTVVGSFLLVPKRFDAFNDDTEGFGVLLSAIDRPVKEIYHPSFRFLRRDIIQLLPIQYLKDDISVDTIVLK